MHPACSHTHPSAHSSCSSTHDTALLLVATRSTATLTRRVHRRAVPATLRASEDRHQAAQALHVRPARPLTPARAAAALPHGGRLIVRIATVNIQAVTPLTARLACLSMSSLALRRLASSLATLSVALPRLSSRAMHSRYSKYSKYSKYSHALEAHSKYSHSKYSHSK